jgi:hypothetical protein
MLLELRAPAAVGQTRRSHPERLEMLENGQKDETDWVDEARFVRQGGRYEYEANAMAL